MSTSRRDEILRAEEAVRALASELASARDARQTYEQACSALREALNEVSIAGAHIHSTREVITEESAVQRERLKSATDELGATTDFAHERLKETVASFQLIGDSIDSRSQQQLRALQDLESAIQDDLSELNEQIKVIPARIDTLSAEHEHNLVAMRASLGRDLDEIAQNITTLDIKLSRHERYFKVTLGTIATIGLILLLVILLT